MNVESAARLPGRFYLFDVVFADVPGKQSTTCRVEELASDIRPCRKGAGRFQRQQVLLLRRDELGTVDRHQRLALLDEDPREVDVEPLDPSGKLGVDEGEPALVILDAADRPNVPNHWPYRDGGQHDSEQLLPIGREADRAGRHRGNFLALARLRFRRRFALPHLHSRHRWSRWCGARLLRAGRGARRAAGLPVATHEGDRDDAEAHGQRACDVHEAPPVKAVSGVRVTRTRMCPP